MVSDMAKVVVMVSSIQPTTAHATTHALGDMAARRVLRVWISSEWSDSDGVTSLASAKRDKTVECNHTLTGMTDVVGKRTHERALPYWSES
ncbi:hypothetical protein E2C01_047105 [Portunus trituberculatus]|uniref:Uncharacterized protein n=1 Tax=Portunus trituberculatus TaxID=210409 RepID=A0A5B7G719_PORTR|nr:hypothetical protein [Portunus trituberculatus]